jgi:hypothetical protein
VFHHGCDGLSHHYAMWTNSRVVLYRGDVSHMSQPEACSDERLRTYGVARPSAYPYSPLHV